MSNSSTIHLKNIHLEINNQVILEKIKTLDIYCWSYTTRPEESHIGPTAEDFYAAFGTGGDESKISTIDVDEVIRAGVKALKQENEELGKTKTAYTRKRNN